MSVLVNTRTEVFVKDQALSPNPRPVSLGGVDLLCQAGAIAQDVVIPAASSALQVPFPTGVTSAKLLAIFATAISDLIVTYKGQTVAVPLGAPVFFYGVGPTDVTFASAGGGKVATVVGG